MIGVLEGTLNLIKPPGMTSHDVVGYVRRILGQKRVGHTGTLDPLAAGLLVICVGRATRISRFLTTSVKCYRAEVTFGVSTSTQDAAGDIEEISDASSLTADDIIMALDRQKGTQWQVPPMASAVRHQGRKLYELARTGLEVERQPREIEIFEIRALRLDDLGTARPRALFEVTCSKGTYVRTLCFDIGRSVGLPAFNSFLLRTGVGAWAVNAAFTLEELAGHAREGSLENVLVSVDEALAHLPVVLVKEAACQAVLNGRTLYAPGIEEMPRPLDQYVRLRGSDGLLAVAERVTEADSDTVAFKPVWVRSRI
ncbi:MAG: tRNA pseudouridine(55) synthase TruB [Clostridia bacterium]|nr:tRNA pseudouridine(55) synthase TruB [Clostridia bacterium]MDQ7790840.1 tRNA pseudouridine(55) synthase TruB [Clostridia bacterium]